jgi:hypothetical protein
MSRLVLGHSVNGKRYHFPHRCPGAGCAIRGWLERQERRAAFAGLAWASAFGPYVGGQSFQRPTRDALADGEGVDPGHGSAG